MPSVFKAIKITHRKVLQPACGTLRLSGMGTWKGCEGMKKKMWLRAAAALAGLFLMVFFLPQAEAAKQERKLTIMVYLCGSNLESTSGAASADIQEMLDAGAGSADVSLLVMTGGTRSWAMGFDPEKTMIHEIRGGRQRCVWSADKMDMGKGETLTAFLRYGKENYPAEKYALVLWDHGAGPLGAVCWDELFSMSHMTLRDMRDAIRSAMGATKLSWIGFDACLMGSLEVASELSAVAEYMVASQETEPAFGWNYAFLSGLTGEESPEETGRRIVDAYFENREESREIMTLACINLEKARQAAETLGSFFSDVEKEINADSFSELSGLRLSSVSFGKSVETAVESSGYDLVDARDLVSRIGLNPEEKEQVLSALEAAVVYSRSNENGAGGLTLYHPYHNKTRWLSEWKDSYLQMNLIRGYTRYVQSFGSLLTGEDLVRWVHLQTQEEESARPGETHFSLQLTEEQAAHFASGKLLVIGEKGQNTLGEDTALFSVSPAEMDENGILHGTYSQDILYVEKENGKLLGPIGYRQTEDGLFNVVSATYLHRDEGADSEDVCYVQFYLAAEDRSPHPEIVRTQVWDEMTESYSNRLAFSEEQYQSVLFKDQGKTYPGASEGALPDYYAWEPAEKIALRGFLLPNRWQFTHLQEQAADTQLYAMFEITDVQQNVCCSVPVPVENPGQQFFTNRTGTVPFRGCDITLAGYINTSANPGVHLMLTVKNRENSARRLSVNDLLINDGRETGGGYRIDLQPAGETVLEFDIQPEALARITEIQAISFIMKEEVDGKTESGAVSFQVEGAGLQAFDSPVSLGSREQGGIRLEILGIQPSHLGGFTVTGLMENQSEEAVIPKSLILNGYQLVYGPEDELPAGRSRVITWYWANGIELDNIDLSIPGKDFSGILVLDHLLALHGQDHIRTVSLLCTNPENSKDNGTILSVELDEPWEVQEDSRRSDNQMIFFSLFPPEAEEALMAVTLAENDRFRVQLQRMVVGEESVVFILEMTNKTKEFLGLNLQEVTLNDGEIDPYDPMAFHSGSWITLLPEVTLTKAVCMNSYRGVQPGMEIRSAAMLFYEFDTMPWTPAVITLPVPAVTGGPNLQWFSADQLTVEPGRMPEEDPEEAGTGLVPEVLLPDRASSLCQWLEAPLSEAEMKAAESGTLVMVLPARRLCGEKAAASWAVPVLVQDMEQNEAGKWGALFPGLLPCADMEPENLIPIRIREMGTNRMLANIGSIFELYNSDYSNNKSVLVKVKLAVDYEANRAEVTDPEFIGIYGNSPMKTWEIQSITWYSLMFDLGEEQDGKYPCYYNMETVSGQLTGWNVKPGGHPLRIRMRPVTPEDEISIIFSVTNRDGSEYSVIRPWSEIVSGNP